MIVCWSTVTHARPSAIVIACGLPPTEIVAWILSVRGSIRVTVPSPLLATHTEPAPTATPAGECPTAIVVVTDSVIGSIRTTALSSESATHTAPSPNRDPGRSVADRDWREQPARIDARDVVALGVGQPDGPVAAERDRRRARVRIDVARRSGRSLGQGG